MKKEDIFPEIQTYLYEQLPIPKINPKNSKIAEKIVNLVEQILALKAENSNQKSPSLAEGDLGGGYKNTENSATDTSKLEQEIDNLVYALYDLNESEIALINKLHEEQKMKNKTKSKNQANKTED